MLACQISHKSWVRQDQLCHLAFIFEPTFLNFKIDYIQNSFIQNSKMTKIKKTLGRNWTCYHNYYGMVFWKKPVPKSYIGTGKL